MNARAAMSLAAFLSLMVLCALSFADAAGQAQWEQQVGAKLLEQPAFQYVEEDPALPRVLLIGDSISIGYTVPVREILRGKANVLRIPTNGGPTSNGIKCLDQWLGKGKWDVIHFNFGLHDLKRMKDGKLDIGGEWQIAPEQYEKNLHAIVKRLKTANAKLIWATTTPVPEGASGRVKGDEVKSNAIAEKVMRKYHVPIDDLYAHVMPHLAEYQQPHNVHFTPQGSEFLAKQVATKIIEELR